MNPKRLKFPIISCALLGLVACAGFHENGSDSDKKGAIDLTASETDKKLAEMQAALKKLASQPAPVNSATPAGPQPDRPASAASVAPVNTRTQQIAALQAQVTALQSRLAAQRSSSVLATAERQTLTGGAPWPIPVISLNQLVTVDRRLKALGYDCYLAVQGQTITFPLAPLELRGKPAPAHMLILSGRLPADLLKWIMICTLEQARGNRGRGTDRQGYSKQFQIFPQAFTVRRAGELAEVDHFMVDFHGTSYPVQCFVLPDSLLRYVVGLRSYTTGRVDSSQELSFWIMKRGDIAGGGYGNFGHAQTLPSDQNRQFVGWSNHSLGLDRQWRAEGSNGRGSWDQIKFLSNYVASSVPASSEKGAPAPKPTPKKK